MVIRVFAETRRVMQANELLRTLMEFLRAVGDELRHARQEAGLALRDLNLRSAREFKASAVGGYERGERSISLDRFCRLAELYGVPADRLLARVLERSAPAADDVVIDLRAAQETAAPDLAGSAESVASPGSSQPT